jgi:hypothetical protein
MMPDRCSIRPDRSRPSGLFDEDNALRTTNRDRDVPRCGRLGNVHCEAHRTRLRPANPEDLRYDAPLHLNVWTP